MHTDKSAEQVCMDAARFIGAEYASYAAMHVNSLTGPSPILKIERIDRYTTIMQTMNNTEFPPHFSHFKPPVYAAQQHDHAPSRPELWPLQLSRHCKYRDGNFVIILFIPDSASSVPALQGVKAKTWVREDMFETWELCPESLEGLVDLAQQRESSGSESCKRKSNSHSRYRSDIS